MEKNKRDPYAVIQKALPKLRLIFPEANLYDIIVEEIEQPKDPRFALHGITEVSADGGVRRIIIDPRFKDEEIVNTLAHELLHAQQLQLGKGSDLWEDDTKGAHNAPFTDELHKRIVQQWPQFKKQIMDERDRKLTPYELLIKREQEKVFGPGPDLKYLDYLD